MVYEIRQNKYGIFFETFVFTILILIIGFSLGYMVESYRTNQIIDDYKDHEIESLDLKLQNYYYQIMDRSSCEKAIKKNFEFADDLYITGLELEKYEQANQITDDIFREKKRYVLLKTELWLNSILLKEKCDKPFDTIVYFYSGDPTNNIKVAEQKVISNVLKTVKENNGNSVILLPIAGDLKKSADDESLTLGIVDLQMQIYDINSFPSILINEDIVLEGFHSVEEIERYLNQSSSSRNYE